jgi:carbon storage regulator
MLMMSRRQGETILIGDQIEIVINHIGRSRVKVGIRAPRELSVVAKEVRLVGEENRAAAQAPSPGLLTALLAQLQPGLILSKTVPMSGVSSKKPDRKTERISQCSPFKRT